MILFVLCEVWSRPSVGFSNNLISDTQSSSVCVCVWNGVTVTVLLLVSLFCAPRSLFIPSHLLLLVFLCLPGNLIIRSLSAPLASRSATLSLSSTFVSPSFAGCCDQTSRSDLSLLHSLFSSLHFLSSGACTPVFASSRLASFIFSFFFLFLFRGCGFRDRVPETQHFCLFFFFLALIVD